jgi:hypothetical protein
MTSDMGPLFGMHQKKRPIFGYTAWVFRRPPRPSLILAELSPGTTGIPKTKSACFALGLSMVVLLRFDSLFVRKLFVFSVPDFGGRGGRLMKKPIYTDEPMGKLHAIPDFLPPPEELFPRREGIKVTLTVDRDSVDFFRSRARRSGLKYQRMMREVLREYSHRYKTSPTSHSIGQPHTGRR